MASARRAEVAVDSVVEAAAVHPADVTIADKTDILRKIAPSREKVVVEEEVIATSAENPVIFRAIVQMLQLKPNVAVANPKITS